MGHDIGGLTAVLEFEPGTRLEHNTVRVSLDISIGRFLAMQRTLAADLAGPAAWEQLETLYREFGDDVLKEWDVVIEGRSLPANGDGMSDLPVAAASELIRAWAAAVTSVQGNSPAASANGRTSEAAIHI